MHVERQDLYEVNMASDSSMCADCELLTQCDDTGRGQWYFRNSRLGHKEDGEVKALWSDCANRRLMISPSGGVEDKYGQYINYRNEEFNMLKEDWIFRRGDIYLVELEPRIGFVQSGTRPVIVLQNNCGNFFAPTLIVAPLTSNIYKKRNLPTH